MNKLKLATIFLLETTKSTSTYCWMAAPNIYRHQWSIMPFQTLLRLLRSMVAIPRGKRPLRECCIQGTKNHCDPHPLEPDWNVNAGWRKLRCELRSVPVCDFFIITSGNKVSATAIVAGCSAGCLRSTSGWLYRRSANSKSELLNQLPDC